MWLYTHISKGAEGGGGPITDGYIIRIFWNPTQNSVYEYFIYHYSTSLIYFLSKGSQRFKPTFAAK